MTENNEKITVTATEENDVQTAETSQNQSDKAKVLSRWIPVLFWLIIAGLIVSVISTAAFASISPAFETAGQVISAVCAIAEVVAFFALSRTNENYRYAAICCIIVLAVNALSMLVGLIPGVVLVSATFVLNIAVMFITLGAEYTEIKAHSEVLKGVDDKLSGKWLTLWKWHLGLFIPVLACYLLLVICARFASMSVLAVVSAVSSAASIALMIVSIFKMVYLCKMTKFFKEKDA